MRFAVARATGPVACGTPRASFVARAARPWLAVIRKHRSYSTDLSNSAAFLIVGQKSRLRIAWIDGVPSIGAGYGTSRAGSPCHGGIAALDGLEAGLKPVPRYFA